MCACVLANFCFLIASLLLFFQDTVSLTVVVQDVNDNPPVFENTATNSDLIVLPEVRFHLIFVKKLTTHYCVFNLLCALCMHQNEATGTIVYSMIVSDPDTGSGGNFHFSYPNPVHLKNLLLNFHWV